MIKRTKVININVRAISILLAVYIIFYTIFFTFIYTKHLFFSFKTTIVLLLPFLFLIALIQQMSRFRIKRYQQKYLVISFIIGLLVFGICLTKLSINEYKTIYNHDKWIASEDERFYMVENMLKKEELVGKGKTEVIEVLGTPTSTTPDNKIVYFLGPQKNYFNEKSKYLTITFNAEDRVLEHNITEE